MNYLNYLNNLEEKEYLEEEYIECKEWIKYFQNHRLISSKILSEMSNKCLCFLYRKLEDKYFCSYMGEEMGENLNYYSLCKKEMEKRNIL